MTLKKDYPLLGITLVIFLIGSLVGALLPVYQKKLF